jgi:hypothetical protein
MDRPLLELYQINVDPHGTLYAIDNAEAPAIDAD